MRSCRFCRAIFFLFLMVSLCSCATMHSRTQVITPAPSESRDQAVAKPEISTPQPGEKGEAAPQKDQAAEGDKADDDEEEKAVLPTGPLPDRWAVGCILPLTGRFAEEGNKALDALLLSAETFNVRYSTPWRIVVADSGESPEGMQKAMAYLADSANVMGILAVAGSADAEGAAREAEKRKIPLILISSKEGLTEGRSYVFQHFLTPTQQMQALSRYALDQLNIAIFSILYPRDDYGEEMLRAFTREIERVGGKINKAVPYEKTQTDFSEQISQLIGRKLDTSKKSYATTEEAKAKISVDFEGLFIPDSPLRVKMIASQLAFYDVKGFQFLGTSLWQAPELTQKGVEYIEGAVFTDSFLRNGFLPETNDFVDIYYTAHRREPEKIEALAYDTMEIVLGILEDENVKSRDDFIGTLRAVELFQGATGSVYFRGSSVAQKNAFLIKILNGKLEQVR